MRQRLHVVIFRAHIEQTADISAVALVVIHTELIFKKSYRTRGFSVVRPAVHFRKIHNALVYLSVSPASEHALSGRTYKKCVNQS